MQKKAKKKTATRGQKPSPRPQWLFVQTAGAAELIPTGRPKVGTLTLFRLARTIKFADRPIREAKHEPTKKFFEEWGNGWDSFANDPPNAELVVFTGGPIPLTATVVLTNPKWDPQFENRLTYTVKAIGDSELPVFSGFEVALFIDNTGAPTMPGAKCPKSGWWWSAGGFQPKSPDTWFKKDYEMPVYVDKKVSWKWVSPQHTAPYPETSGTEYKS